MAKVRRTTFSAKGLKKLSDLAESLIPCPYCGGEPCFVYYIDDGGEKSWSVLCAGFKGCGVETGNHPDVANETGYERAARVWNKRAGVKP